MTDSGIVFVIQLIGSGFINYVFGSTLLAGLFFLFVIALAMKKMNLPIPAVLVVGLPTVIFLSLRGYLPDWFLVLIAIAMGILIAIGVLKIFKRQ